MTYSKKVIFHTPFFSNYLKKMFFFLLWKTAGFQGCTAAYWQTGGTELARRHSDGKRLSMSFTFADADYIKTYIILPLYHMWAKHIPVACKCWGYCPSNLCTWDSSQSTCPTALLHGANVGLYQRMWLHGIDITKKRTRKKKAELWHDKSLKLVAFRGSVAL